MERNSHAQDAFFFENVDFNTTALTEPKLL
jgi:hypothetical protein